MVLDRMGNIGGLISHFLSSVPFFSISRELRAAAWREKQRGLIFFEKIKIKIRKKDAHR